MLANARKSTTAWCRLTSSWSANRLCLLILRVWSSTENLPRSKQNSELFAHRQPRCHWPCRADEARMFCPLTRSFSSCRRQLACLRYRLFSPGRARFRARCYRRLYCAPRRCRPSHCRAKTCFRRQTQRHSKKKLRSTTTHWRSTSRRHYFRHSLPAPPPRPAP